MRDSEAAVIGRAEAAAILASGIGSLSLGLLTTLAESCSPIRDALVWHLPTGSLSGKTSAAVLVWLLAWLVLHHVPKTANTDLRKVLLMTSIMVAIGMIGTFPPFYGLFSARP